MTISLPSNKSITIDAPGEIGSLSGEFVYNFYVPDETINDSPRNALPNFIRMQLADQSDVAMYNTFRNNSYRRFIPRSVSLTWNPVDIGNTPADDTTITANIQSVQNEETISGNLFTAVTFKDNGTDGKIMYAIQRALQEIVKAQNLPPINSVNSSPLDIVKILNSITSDNIQGNFLADSFISLNNAGYTFLKKQKLDETVKSLSERLKEVKLKVSINNKFISTILNASTQDSDNIYADETIAVLPGATAIQDYAIAQFPLANNVQAAAYETSIPNYVDFELTDLTDVTSTYRNIGYIIAKTEYPFSGGHITKTDLIVEGASAREYIDYNIKYGTRYGYTIRTVFLLKLPAIGTDGGLGVVSLLIASQATNETVVDCRENRPPEPPTDFNITWDYQLNHPRLTWNFPVDSQRDTKYFQIFKRSSIDEPFQLIKMYDFNDSVSPLSIQQMSEYNIDPALVETLRNSDGSSDPKSIYIDYSFEKESDAIYAIACVDAHGMASNYSTQLRATFNRYKNKIVKQLISVTGAPKAYPNFFYNKDTFVDSIRTSNVSNLDIYFNPEYLKVNDTAGHDLELLKTNGAYDYQLQLINIDLQKDVKINIDIKKLEEPVVVGAVGGGTSPVVKAAIRVK
jgi:hypothetical protein